MCPCALMLDFGKDMSLVKGPVRVIVMADDYSLEDSLSLPESGVIGLNVPRKPELGVAAAYVPGESSFGAGGVIIPLGHQFLELYHSYNRLSSDAESCKLDADLKKNFCRLKITLVSNESLSDSEFYIEGTTCGVSMEGIPLRGPFKYKADFGEDDVAMVILPRQADDSLQLTTRASGDIVQSFCIGKYISQTGYDWNAPDLGDVEILIDYAHSDITVTVAQWEKVFSFDVVI